MASVDSITLKLAAVPMPKTSIASALNGLGKPTWAVPNDIPKLVQWGNNHSFAQRLLDLIKGSPTAASVVRTRARLIAGQGLGMLEDEKLKTFFAGVYGPKKDNGFRNGFGRCLKIWAHDLAVFRTFAALIYWDAAGKNITGIEARAYKSVALGQLDLREDVERVTWGYLCRDWANKGTGANQFPVLPVPMYDPSKAAQQPVQLYVSDIPDTYYPTIDLYSALNAMETEASLGRYQANTVANKFTAASVMVVPDPPARDDANGLPVPIDQLRREFIGATKKKFTGEGDAESLMVIFTDNPEQAAKLFAVPSGATYQLYDSLEGYCRRVILSALQVANPAVVGISDGASLGGDGNAMRIAYELEINTHAEPAKTEIIGAVKDWLLFTPVAKAKDLESLGIDTAVPVRPTPSEATVLQLFQSDELAFEYFGMGAYWEREATFREANPTPEPAAPGAPAVAAPVNPPGQ